MGNGFRMFKVKCADSPGPLKDFRIQKHIHVKPVKFITANGNSELKTLAHWTTECKVVNSKNYHATCMVLSQTVATWTA